MPEREILQEPQENRETIFLSILAAEADKRFGPEGWQSVCAIFGLEDGDSIMIRAVNKCEQQSRAGSSSP